MNCLTGCVECLEVFGELTIESSGGHEKKVNRDSRVLSEKQETMCLKIKTFIILSTV